MARRSPFDYDVSVAADKRRRMRTRGMSGAFETSERVCENPGCDRTAQYRAPAAPDRLNEFRWFCLEHVRDYNASWNFFANRSDDEVDQILRGATTWERPTWTLGQGAREGGTAAHEPGRAWARFGISDPMDVLGAAATISPGPQAEADPTRPRRRLSREEQRALDTLGVPHQVAERAAVRAAYRGLVKDLHPDMNGGENPDPERLARVLKAWDILRRSPNFTD
ncbi:J domain-containing protein [Paralimibaculum aggregatum]|uniref:J domain-containing protein n=1 Tax=Paralimibaculum aggregatum TaxID=3036245 RepID=A0ABQ6LGQ8_9RHOB|nr:J domain-containing protein [Limibaculum sp. NKW23]GMG81410.1 J domain-containing protein [Limibaculum sp. NKW23]